MFRNTLNYIKIFKIVLRSPDVLNPNVIVKSVKDINFEHLRSLGIQFIVFDKDNTLTKTYEKNYFDSGISNSINEAKEILGAENLAVLSNSENKDTFDQDLNLNFIKYKTKKPFNFLEVKSHFNKSPSKIDDSYLKNHKIAIVGDRLMTDVLLANMNNAVSIYSEPLEKSHEKFTIKLMRAIEGIILKSFKGLRRVHISYKEPQDVLQRISSSHKM